MKLIKKYWFPIVILLISIIRFLFSCNLPSIYLINLRYDDLLMVDQFRSILEGKYLGTYGETTLVKTMIFPHLLALSKLLHISFTNFFTILYILSSIYFVNSLKKIIKNKWFLILIYLLIVFNPVTYSSELLQRLYVNTIVIPELLFFFGTIIKILTDKDNKLINYIILGIISSLMILTRNDFVWIYIIIPILIIIKLYKNIHIKTILLNITPIIILVLSLNIVSLINYKYYGVYTYNELDNSEFTNAYKRITEIKSKDKKIKVDVPKTTLYKLPEISDTFNFTKEEIDVIYTYKDVKNGEVENGFIVWYLRNLIYEKEQFKTGKEANTYFKNLSNDIEKAFKEKKLKKGVSLFSVYLNPSTKENYKLVPKSILKAIKYTSSYQNIKAISRKEIKNNKKVIGYDKDIDSYAIRFRNFTLAENFFTNNILLYEIIRIIYKYFTIIFSIISLFIYIKNIKKKDNLNTIIHLVLLTYLIILFGVSYTDATSVRAIIYRYLSCIYILQSIFIILNLYRLFDKEKKTKKH